MVDVPDRGDEDRLVVRSVLRRLRLRCVLNHDLPLHDRPSAIAPRTTAIANGRWTRLSRIRSPGPSKVTKVIASVEL
jgi:hypothetical protein